MSFPSFVSHISFSSFTTASDLRKKKRIQLYGNLSDVMGHGSTLSAWSTTGGLFTEAGAEAGPLGCVVGLLLDLVVSIILVIVIAFLLWFGINIVTTGIVVLLLPLYLLFRRSLRVAIARGRTCRGNLSKSLKFAFLVTITNMVWLYLIIFTDHHISRWLSK